MIALALEPSVQVSLVTAGGTLGVALLGIAAEFLRRQAKAISEVADNAQEARDQVANTHSTNLRDDLDAVAYRIDRVLALQEQHSNDIAALRADIAHERRERLAVSERLDDHMAANAA
ncbi:membrane protein [Streptomyces phage Triumph]|nr:membrane protein [Streptomyces phage Triumph]